MDGGKTLLTLDGDCDCHWVVVHAGGVGVMKLAVMIVVIISSFTTRH